MKNKLSLLDVIAITRDLSSRLLSMRVNNIYDVDSKTFLLRLQEAGGKKATLLIESGVRVHTTRYVRDKPILPGAFCMKLRKHIRGRRLTGITQMGGAQGTERVLDFAFGSGEATYHLIVELYDRGNVILTDKDYIILSLLRQYQLDKPGAAGAGEDGIKEETETKSKGKDKEKGPKKRVVDDSKIRVAVKQKYLLGDSEAADGSAAPAVGSAVYVEWTAPDIAEGLGTFMATLDAKPMNARQRKKLTIAAALTAKGSGVDMFGPVLAEHACGLAGLDPSAQLGTLKSKSGTAPFDLEKLTALAHQLKAIPQLLRDVATKPSAAYAFVEARPSAPVPATPAKSEEASGASSKLGLSFSAPVRQEVDTDGLPTSGCIGAWESIQRKFRAGLVTESAAAVLPLASVPQAGKGAADDDAAAAAAADAPEEDLSAESQMPPDIPYNFVDFTPLLLSQYVSPDVAYIEFPDFDSLVDEYFSRADIVKAEKAEAAARTAAMKKLDRIREGHKEALVNLEATFSLNYFKARLIESQAADVEAACIVIRSALEHGLNWGDLERFVDAEKASGKRLAQLIDKMDLPHARITLALRDYAAAAAATSALGGADSESDSEDEAAGQGGVGALHRRKQRGVDKASDAEASATDATDAEEEKPSAAAVAPVPAGKQKGKVPKGGKRDGRGGPPQKYDEFTTLVEVDVMISAASNARQYFEAGKSAREKREKTAAASDVAIKKAEKQAERDASKKIASASAVRAINVARKPAWYERFNWFITLEGLVVVAGKNAQDNEMLYKRYMRPQDAYIHADIHGAATVIVRNPSTDPASFSQLPRYALSLEHAGAFCIGLSAAWSSHVTTSAYWVYANQVSKTAPTGEYLTTGSFMIRGKKNMLPPVRLELGLAILFKVDPMCVSNHLGDRYIRGGEIDDETAAARLADDVAEMHVEIAPEAVEETAEVSISPPPDAPEAPESPELAADETAEPEHEEPDATEAARPGFALDDEEEESSSSSSESEEGAKEAEKDTSASASAPSIAPTAKPVPVKRGKQGKMKKLKEKYADQDDEDRSLAMKAIGHSFVPAPVAPAVPPKRGIPAASADGSEPRKRGPKPQKKKEEDEPVDESFAAAVAAETEGTALASLVMVPRKDDIVTHAVPMLCPYPVALACKYRIKLLPGTLKKGKAAQSAAVAFAGLAKHAGTPREAELIKAMTDVELSTAIVGNVKVTAAAAATGSSASAPSGAARASTTSTAR